jgi:indolepyruvate ferredoxin oxidoreductase beta subunit
MKARRRKRAGDRKRGGAKGKGFDLALAGVGGQGILLAGRIVCQAAMGQGYKVNAFESHGMAQRGGAVVNHIRWGGKDEVHSSLMLEGEADMLVALEPVEAIRHLTLLGKSTVVVLNMKTMPPITVSSVAGAKYPTVKQVVKALRPHVGRVVTVDGTGLAEEVGNTAVLSMVMIGAAFGTGRLPLKRKELRRAIEELVPERYVEENLKAFDLGQRRAGKGRG